MEITAKLIVSMIIFLVVVSMIRCLIYQHILLKRLREKYTEKWKEITTLPGLGPGFVNGPKGLSFIFGSDDLDDPEILRLKVITRNSFLYAITGMIAAFVTSGIWPVDNITLP